MNTESTTTCEMTEVTRNGACKKFAPVLVDTGVKQQVPTTGQTNKVQVEDRSWSSPKHQQLVYPDLGSLMMKQTKQIGAKYRGPSGEKCGGITNNTMKVKLLTSTRAKQSNIAPEGIHNATVHNIEIINKDDGSGVKAVKLEFKLKDQENTVKRPYAPSFGGRNPFRSDCVTLLGRNLTPTEMKGDFETDDLKGRNCRVFIKHQLDGFGKPKAIVKSVLAAEEPAVSTQ